MNLKKATIHKVLLLACLSVCVLAGSAAQSWGVSSFTGINPVERELTVNSTMTAYSSRTLIVNFGDSNEVKYTNSSEEQPFDFDALLDAPVDREPDTVESQPVPGEESSDISGQQPTAVPEPSTLVLLLGFGSVLLLIRKRWRKHDRT